MAVYFFNQSTIDLNAVTVMGVSVKETDNPIGFFGTGLKFAIATLLRFGCTVSLIRSGETIKFGVERETIRGEEFDRVVMGGEKLAFTTKLGRNWQPWQAYRELYSNCMDEGGWVSTIPPVGSYGTVFVVEGDAIEECHRNRGEIFLQSEPIAATDRLEIHKGERDVLFYRGIRALKLSTKGLFTYNVLANAELTEDRTIKYEFLVRDLIARSLVQVEDEEIIEAVLTRADGRFEQCLSFDVDVEPSHAFMSFVGRSRHNTRILESARRLWERHAGNDAVFQEVSLDRFEVETLDAAFKLLRRLGCDIQREDFKVVSGLGPDVVGLHRKGQILISRRAFDVGPRFLAGTLYEEWMHATQGIKDESRAFQNHLMDQLFAMTERVCRLENEADHQLMAAE